jgi:hypothetical protein
LTLGAQSGLERILGGKSVVPLMARADLQRYVDKRAGEWIDPEVYRRKRREKAALAKPKRKYVRKNAPQNRPRYRSGRSGTHRPPRSRRRS